jgi:transketolase
MTRVLLALVLLTGVAEAHQDEYPMTAAAYRKRFETRLTRYKERLEQRMKEHSTATDKRDAARKKLSALETELRKLVDGFAADDTITLGEADQVKARGKQGREAIYKDLGIAHGKGE